MAKPKFTLAANAETKAYDIFIQREDTKDVRVATVYDPDYVDLFLEVLDMADTRTEEQFSPPDTHSVYVEEDMDDVKG